VADDGTPARQPEAPWQRAARPGAPGRGTRSVPDVKRLVEDAVASAFATRTWVTGRVGRTHADVNTGALRFALHSSGDDDVAFGLQCVVAPESLADVRDVLDRVHDAELSAIVWEGRLARVGGLLRYDADRNGVVLSVTDLDPAVTARGLDDEREHALARAHSCDLAARQARRPVPRAPLRVALVREEGDPAGLAVRERLEASPYAVDVRDCPGTLHGPRAGSDLGRRVREATLLSEAVLLVRGGGRPLGLGPYDADEVARAIVDSPVPVVCGLGGSGVVTAADAVAYSSVPTAEDAAGWVLGRLEESQQALRALEAGIGAAATAAVTRAWTDLQQVREQTARAAEDASVRARQAERRRWVRLQVGAALVAALVVGVAVGTGSLLVLLGLLVPVLVLAGVWLWSRSARTRGSRSMGSHDDEFAEVVERLRDVRDQLEGTSSPEQVHRLRLLSSHLVERGEDILLRHFPDHPEPRSPQVPEVVDEQPAPEPAGEPPAPPAPPAAAAPAGPAQSNVRTVALSGSERITGTEQTAGAGPGG